MIPTPYEVRERVSRIVHELPEAVAFPVPGTTHVRLEVLGKRFGWLMENHHGNGRIELNCRAPQGMQQALIAADPRRYYYPDYVGSKGWTAAWLDIDDIDWSAVEEMIREGYKKAAPKKLLKAHPEL